MFTFGHTKICNKEQVVEQFYRASFVMLFVYDDISTAPSPVASNRDRIIEASRRIYLL
jgi:hypothetical protein